MRTLIVIPARLAATRLPHKPLCDLGGVPLVVAVARQASRCPGVDQVAIATDAPAVVEAAQAYGIAALRSGRPHASGTDRVAEAAHRLEADHVVNLQGDEPFVHPNDLYDLLAALRSGSAEVASLQRPLGEPAHIDDPSVVKVVTDDAGCALYFSRLPIPYGGSPEAARGGRGAEVSGHIGVYAYTLAALKRFCQAPAHRLELAEGLEQLRALAMGLKIKMLPARTTGRGIDTPADLRWAQQRVAALGADAYPCFEPEPSP